MPLAPHTPAAEADDHAALIVALDAGDLAGADLDRAPGARRVLRRVRARSLGDLAAIRGALPDAPGPAPPSRLPADRRGRGPPAPDRLAARPRLARGTPLVRAAARDRPRDPRGRRAAPHGRPAGLRRRRCRDAELDRGAGAGPGRRRRRPRRGLLDPGDGARADGRSGARRDRGGALGFGGARSRRRARGHPGARGDRRPRGRRRARRLRAGRDGARGTLPGSRRPSGTPRPAPPTTPGPSSARRRPGTTPACRSGCWSRSCCSGRGSPSSPPAPSPCVARPDATRATARGGPARPPVPDPRLTPRRRPAPPRAPAAAAPRRRP